MDTSRYYSLTEREIHPNGPSSDDGTLGSTDISTFSDGEDNNQLHAHSTLPSILPTQVYLLDTKRIAAVEANSKTAQCDSTLVVAEGTEERGLVSVNIECIDARQSISKQEVHIASVSLGIGELSDLSSDGGSKSSESRAPRPEFVLSECDPVGVHKPTIEEPDKDLMRVSVSDPEDGLSSEDDSYIIGMKKRAPTIVSWKEQAVDRSTISPIVSKPSKSEISDLGDRHFYADLKEKSLKPTNSFPLDDSQTHLALEDLFYEALVKTHKEKKGFFPRGELSTLVTEDCVFRELTRYFERTHNETQIRAYARNICEEIPQPKEEDDDRPPKIKSFKKIFAILVLIEQTPCITKFLEEDVNDLDLPLSKFEKGKNGTRFDLRLKHNLGKRLECFRTWTQFPVTAFEEWQWTTISPFFHKGAGRDLHHFPLPDSINLPFTTDSRRDKTSDFRSEIEGGFGRVFKVHIHPDHHNFGDAKSQRFAIKRLNSHNKEDFNKEVEMLKMFNDKTYRHRHLITLLATYEQFGVYHLIFPCADDDLTGFWSRKNPCPSFDLETIEWVAEQCEGIAEGLHRIHQYQTSNSKASSHEKRYGRHGDLKPENILWFSNDNGGMLMISDFGLAEYSTNHSRSYKHKSRVATSMSYRPPECDLKDGQVGQSYDIWTLGCLYLEFITWLLGGWDLVQKFQKKRMSFDPMWYDMDTDAFFELVQCDKSDRTGVIAAMVKPAVTEFMQELHAHELCTDFLHDFINMVEIDMLLVKPNNPKEKRFFRRRITSAEVHTKLKKMRRQFKRPGYACHPSPWCNISARSPTSEEVVEVDITDEVVHWKKFRHYEGPVQEQEQPETLAVPPVKRGRYK